MRQNFDECLTEVLKHEGGYVNHPKDPGGRTNLGVTQQTYEDWIGHKVDERIMRGLTRAHVEKLYKAKYWDFVKGDSLPYGLDLCVFDFAVNAGPNRAARYLQRLIGVKQDGTIGPVSLAKLADAIKAEGRASLITRYQSMREEYYRALSTFPTFGKGWLRRVKDVTTKALAMARKP
jgi:lysozyme family protein